MQEVLRPILVAARGIELMNMATLRIKRNGGTDDELKQSFLLWLEDYRSCWLSSNKRSQLVKIEKFVSNI